MDGASGNHMTIGHVIFREAKFYFFLVVDTSQRWPLSFVAIFSSTTYVQIILHEPFPYTRKKCKFLTTAIQHFLFCGTAFATLFMTWDFCHVLWLCVIYAYKICHFSLTFWIYVDLVLGYVFPYYDHDTSRGSVSVFVCVTILLVVFDIELVDVFEECFLKSH